MWKEELDTIIHNGGIHYIDYRLKNGDVVTFWVRGVRYYGQYCILADSRTDSNKSYWMERCLTISKIKSIDGIPYEQSIEYLNFLKKEEEKKRKKNNPPKTSSIDPDTEGKLGCMGFFGMAGFIAGAAIGGGFGAIAGIILGSIFAIWFYNMRCNS